MSTVHRVQVNFSEGAYATLSELAESRGKSMSEILREAIALEKWFQDTWASGDKILVENRRGVVRELVPR